MTTSTRKRNRFWVPLVVLMLAAALALGGCAKAAQNGAGSPGTTQNPGTSQATNTTSQNGNSGNTSQEIQQLQQIDQQNQNDQNTLNTDDQNSNQNNGSDQEVTP